MEPLFVPGLELSQRFYREAVLPVLEGRFPGLPHTAARVGGGSEVLGYDTPRSADHEWGPRLQLLLTEADTKRYGARITQVLSEQLPTAFLGHPTHFVSTGADPGVGSMRATTGPVDHRVEVAATRAWLSARLGFDPAGEITTLDWLATPWQRLLEVTAGRVYRDDLGLLVAVRERLAWYPDDLWRHVLACQWQRIAQEEAFPGRCAEVGDRLGCALTVARLSRDLMRLWLLLHRLYPPYGKWLGSAFARLPGSAATAAHLLAAQDPTRWIELEDHLVAAYEATAELHNRTTVGAEVYPHASGYFDRPYRVIHGGRFVDALRSAITTESVGRLPLVGSVDQWVDSTDALADLSRLRTAVRGRLASPTS